MTAPGTLAVRAPDPPFRWADVPLSNRDWLRVRTDDIVGRAYRQACDAVQIGAWLNEARGRLKHGMYLEWVRSELPFSPAAAKRYRQVATAFAAFQMAQFELFDESALYALAQLQAPHSAREHAVQLAEQGERVTRTVALQILDAHRPVPDPDVKAYEGVRKGLDLYRVTDEGGGRAIDQTKLTALREAQDANRRQKTGRALERLAREATTVLITKVDDPDDDVIYTVNCTFPEGGEQRVRNGRKLHWVLLDALNEPEMKHCPHCCEPGEALPASRFSDNALLPDELNSRCKDCEKERKKVRRGGKKRKRKKKRVTPEVA